MAWPPRGGVRALLRPDAALVCTANTFRGDAVGRVYTLVAELRTHRWHVRAEHRSGHVEHYAWLHIPDPARITWTAPDLLTWDLPINHSLEKPWEDATAYQHTVTYRYIPAKSYPVLDGPAAPTERPAAS